ncbi:MAG: TonB-dependent receptor [Acidobacteriota bacterium]|nr:TonB-dependent receptor [Acidobacteriota bacterium]
MAAALVTVPAVFAWQSRLVTAAGDPIVGARVADVRGGAAAVTGPDGAFQLAAEGVPEVLLVEFADGAVVLVRVEAGPVPPSVVTVDASRSEKVDAVASAAGHLLAAPASPVVTASPAEVAERGDQSVQEAIAHLPGTGPASADPDRVPALRGGSDNRTLLMIDGGRVVTERRAGASGGGLHPATWGGVEVIRGPATFLYGSGAMGGVILVRSPWASVQGPAVGRVGTEVRVGGAPTASLSMQWREQGWSLAAGARSAGDPHDARGRDLEGSYRQQSVFAGRSWTAAGSVYHLGLRADRLADAVRLAYPRDFGSVFVPRDENYRLTFQADRPGPIDRALVAWIARGSREIVQWRGPGAGLPASRVGSTTRATDLGARWLLRAESGCGHWAAGAEVGFRTGIEVDNTVAFEGGPPAGAAPSSRALAEGRALAAAAFGLWRRPLSPGLEFSLGGRLEPLRSSAVVAGLRRRTSRLAWAAGASLTARTELGSLTVRVARTFREPSVTDRFAETLTGRGLKLANPGLKPETALQADLAWGLDLGPLRFGVSAYRYAFDGIIVRSFRDSGAAVPVYSFVNQDEATVEGIEAEARVRPAPGWEVAVSLHRLRGATGAGESLAELPPDGGRLVLRRLRGDAWFRIEGFFALADPRPGPGEVRTPSYGIVDLSAGARLTGRWTFRAHLKNALDRFYPLGAEPGSGSPRPYAGPGFRVSLPIVRLPGIGSAP